MIKLQKFPCLLGLFAACHPGTAPDPEPPKLVVQRVTATVKRDALRLIHVRAEHELFVTTPEHPFATPQAGWSPAGELAPGDQVVSARFGTMRVVSVQNESAVQPQAVFNLTVAPSHTYVVGTSQVLVHNGRCKGLAERERDLAEREKEIEAVERGLDELKLKLLVAAVEDKPALEQQIARVKVQIARLKHARANARVRRRKAGPELEPGRSEPEIALGSQAPGSDPVGPTVRALEGVERSLREIGGASASSSQLLAELKSKRGKLKDRLRHLRSREGRQRGIVPVPRRERLLGEAEADYESRKRQVEAAQRELSALLSEAPRFDAKRLHAARTAKLEKEIKSLQLEQSEAKEILDAERRIAELAGRSLSTEAERQQAAAEQRALRALVSKKRVARRKRAGYRRARDDAEAYEALLQQRRNLRRKWLRTADYLADTMRPRDTLELLEEELVARRQGAGSENLDERTEYLTERIAALKALVELAKQRGQLQNLLGTARRRRDKLLRAAQDTQAVEQEIARLKQERDASNVRGVQLRLREGLLKLLDGTTRGDRPGALDEDRLRELERELEGELAAGGHLKEERLREIQHELGESELIDAEFLESIWREAGAEEGAGRELPETPQDEGEDLGTLLRALAQSLQEPPLPERPTALEAGLQALQGELREERNAVETADFALANEQAFLNQTLARPGASHQAAERQRLAELRQQRLQLRIDWRARMQRRLDAARQELQNRQSSEGRRNPALELELERTVALLEHEVQNPSF